MVHVGVLFVVLIVLSIMIIVPCTIVASLLVVFAMSFFVVVVEMPLLVACKTMYVTIVVEVSVEVMLLL